MSHTLLDVLSVWWIVVAVDLGVCYCFIKIVRDTENK